MAPSLVQPADSAPDTAESARVRNALLGRLARPATAWVVLLVSLGLTALAWREATHHAEDAARKRFDEDVARTQTLIGQKVRIFESLLAGVSGIFAIDDVTHQTFHDYIAALDLGQHHPGVLGLGFVRYVTEGERPAVEAWARADFRHDFTITPPGLRDQYGVVVYLEPDDQVNARAIGFDHWSEPLRRTALLRARDSGRAAFTGKIRLIRSTEEDEQPGAILESPVYDRGMPLDTVEQRRAALRGWTYALFRLEDFMRAILANADPEIRVELFDGPEPTGDALLYAGGVDAGSTPPGFTPRLSNTRRMELAGHTWTLRSTTRPAFDASTASLEPMLVGVGGLVIDGLLFSVFWSLVGMGRRAEQLAERMSTKFRTANATLADKVDELERTGAALTESEARWRQIIDTEPECVKLLGPDGTLRQMNTAGLRMIEADTFEQVAGLSVYPVVASRHRKQFQDLTERVFRGESGSMEFQITGLKGTPLWLETHAAPLRNEHGEIINLLGITHDITARKRTEMLLQWEQDALKVVASPASLYAALDQLVLGLEAQTPEALCSVLLLDESGQHLHLGSAPSLPPDYTRQIDGVTIGPNVGSCGAAAFDDRPVIVEDIETDPLWADFRALALSHDLRACWSTPVHSKEGKVVATLAIYYRTARKPSQTELELIERARSIFAIAIERKQAEGALLASRERLELALQGGDLGIWDWYPQTGFTFYGDLGAQMLGYDRDETVQHEDFYKSHIHPDDLSNVVARLRAHLDGQTPLYNSEHRLRTKSGAWKWVLDRGRIAERDDDGRPRRVTGIIADVTARKEAEAALISSQQRYEIAVIGSSDGLWDWDMRTNQAYFAPRWKEMLGYQDHELANDYSTWERLIHPDDLQPTLRSLTGYLAGEIDTYSPEFRMQCKDGSYKWILARGAALRDGEGHPFRMAGSHTDIAERKQNEHALVASQRMIEAIIDAIPVRVFWKDINLVYLGCNAAFAHDAGRDSAKAVVGHDDFGMSWRDQAELYRADDREVIDTGRAKLLIEEPQTTPDGQTITLLTSKIPLRNEQGEVYGVLGTYLDISERKRAEEEVRRLNAELEQRVKERTKDLESFSYSVSHDLRAPLRAIDGFVQILNADYASALDGEGRRILGIVSQSARQMGQLIDDLLAFSRLGRVAMRRVHVDMTRLVQEVCDTLAQTAGSTPQFDVGLLPSVVGDPALLRQAWTNLLGNAIKFSRHRTPPRIVVGGATDGATASYFVQDNGAGFDERYAHKLFGVFQRLHSEAEFEGTGVGLALTHRIIQLHGGSIRAEGKVDVGATFHVTLPAGSR